MTSTLRIVDLCASDYHSVSWKIDTPGQCCSANQDAKLSLSKEIFDSRAIIASQSSMVATQTLPEQRSQIPSLKRIATFESILIDGARREQRQ
mmetsp:Transcript_27806/g.32102  ORF Transcript_27806/g.32102 Transcript_27806/m.32102 type:complete len:93 (+) Transcript_27806:244-522(+)